MFFFFLRKYVIYDVLVFDYSIVPFPRIYEAVLGGSILEVVLRARICGGAHCECVCVCVRE